MVAPAGIFREGRAVCYFVYQDIGHGNFIDNDGKVQSPLVVVRIAKGIYYPLIKLEVSFWKIRRPQEIVEEVCQQ